MCLCVCVWQPSAPHSNSRSLWFVAWTWERLEELSLQTWRCTVSHRRHQIQKNKMERGRYKVKDLQQKNPKQNKQLPDHRQCHGVSDYKVSLTNHGADTVSATYLGRSHARNLRFMLFLFSFPLCLFTGLIKEESNLLHVRRPQFCQPLFTRWL